jgi:carbonic anhydrase
MNRRLDPAFAYGFDLGEAVTIRNAGRSARAAAQSVLASNHLLGTEEVYVVKHTRCDLLEATAEMVHEAIKKNLGVT